MIPRIFCDFEIMFVFNIFIFLDILLEISKFSSLMSSLNQTEVIFRCNLRSIFIHSTIINIIMIIRVVEDILFEYYYLE